MKTMRILSARNSCPKRWIFGTRTRIAPDISIILGAILFLSLFGRESFAQGIGISETSITPDASAILELQSTTRGFLMPRNTAALGYNVQGLMFYNTTSNRINFFNGASWLQIPAASDYELPLTFTNGLTRTTNTITLGGTLTGATTIDNSTFALTLGGATATGGITLGASTGAGQIVNIGSGNSAGADIVNIGTGTAATSKTVNIATTGATATNVSIATGAAAATVTIGNATAGTAVNVNTGAANNATTTLGTTGSQVFASSTANSDRLAMLPQSATATGTFTGTITSSNLTAARTWTLPDISGTIIVHLVSNLSAAAATVTAGTEYVLLNMQIPANNAVVGSTYRVRMVGNSSAAGTLIFRVRVGANGTTADNQVWISTTSAAQVANARAGFDVLVTVRSAATAIADGNAHAGAVLLPTLIAVPATAAIATAANWFIDADCTCSVGTFTAQVASIEEVK